MALPHGSTPKGQKHYQAKGPITRAAEEFMTTSAALADNEKAEVMDRKQALDQAMAIIMATLVEGSITIHEWNEMISEIGGKINGLYNITFKEIQERFYGES